MLKDAPSIKIAKTQSLNPKIIFYDRESEVREEIGAKIAQKNGGRSAMYSTSLDLRDPNKKHVFPDVSPSIHRPPARGSARPRPGTRVSKIILMLG